MSADSQPWPWNLDDLSQNAGTQQANSSSEGDHSIKLGELFPFLLDAMLAGKAWIADFEDDEIRVSPDLYDVVSAYGQFNSADKSGN